MAKLGHAGRGKGEAAVRAPHTRLDGKPTEGCAKRTEGIWARRAPLGFARGWQARDGGERRRSRWVGMQAGWLATQETRWRVGAERG